MDNSFIEKDNAKAKRFNHEDADVYSRAIMRKSIKAVSKIDIMVANAVITIRKHFLELT